MGSVSITFTISGPYNFTRCSPVQISFRNHRDIDTNVDPGGRNNGSHYAQISS
jgi:hypothetical protein